MERFFAAHADLVWLVAGLLLMVAETLAPGVFMMWLGLAALGTGAAVFLLQPVFPLQVMTFAVLAALTLTVAMRSRRVTRAAHLNTPNSGLAGRSVRVLRFEGREGRVRLGDSDWAARLVPDMPSPEPGTILRVYAVEASILVVGPPDGKATEK